MKSKANLIVRWGYIHGEFFLAAFVFVGLLCVLFPDFMLSLFGKWAVLLSSLGAKAAGEFPNSFEMFTHILQRNVIAAALYFLIGLLLQGPLATIFAGAFYAFIVVLAPHTIEHAFAIQDWFLIAIEAFILIVSASISSGIAGETYLVQPAINDWWTYSKKSWRSFSMKAPVSWRTLLPSWIPTMLAGILIISGLILFVAWFEVYGY